MQFSKPWHFKLLNFWPPFLGAGIRIQSISDDFRAIRVSMNLYFWNKNAVGTHFGGSLYSMVDPFIMLMLMQNLGPNYIVWDKAAKIQFRRPGRGRVHAVFKLTEQEVTKIKSDADLNGKTEPIFNIVIKNEAGEVVAAVEKLLYVRKKEMVF